MVLTSSGLPFAVVQIVQPVASHLMRLTAHIDGAFITLDLAVIEWINYFLADAFVSNTTSSQTSLASIVCIALGFDCH